MRVSDPRYRPRDMTVRVDGFGRHRYVEWRNAEGVSATAKLRAAKMQHHYAIRMRDEIHRRGWSIKEYAKEAATSYDRMLKLLRGDTILRLEDIAMADLLVGNVSEFSSEDALELAKIAPSDVGGRADRPHAAEQQRLRESLKRPTNRVEYPLMYR